MINTHNFGIGLSLDGCSVCHSTWTSDGLLICEFWLHQPVSFNRMLAELDSIFEGLNNGYYYFYLADLIGSHRIQNWLNQHNRINRFNVRILPPIAPPASSAIMISSDINDGLISITRSVNMALLHEAINGIAEDETGKAIGSPQSLALLCGVAEPAYRRLSKQEIPIYGRF